MENTSLPNGYKLDIIPKPNQDYKETPLASPLIKDAWVLRVNLYQAIQKRCDRPAYVWFNYRFTHIPLMHIPYPRPLNFQDLINRGLGAVLIFMIEKGYFNFQAFCDDN